MHAVVCSYTTLGFPVVRPSQCNTRFLTSLFPLALKLKVKRLKVEPISELRGINCYMRSHLPPDTSERARLNPSQPGDLPTAEGWKAELT